MINKELPDNFVEVLFWSLLSAVDMPYDSDEEADYSKMDLVGSIFTESYFKIELIDFNLFLQVHCTCTDDF